MKEIRDKARELMKGYCRVCPVCDGKACAGKYRAWADWVRQPPSKTILPPWLK